MFFLSFACFSRGKLGTCLRSCCSVMFSQKKSATLHESWDTGGCALLCQHSFFIVDNLSNTWMNGMLMQMLDPAALTVLGNEIQADYELLCLLLTIPK